MNGQFQVDRGSCATTPESYDATPAIEPGRQRRVWGFVDEFQRLVGEDSEPDIRFFVESWTSGAAAAVESFQQRLRRPAEREDPLDLLCDSDDLDTVSFAHDRTSYAEFAPAAPVSIYEKSSSLRRQRSEEEDVAQTQDEAWREWESFAEERVGGSSSLHPMTKELACQLLGVIAPGTRKQIKAAYRRMVSQWHPDRLELATEEVRQMANERMATINEAYHLLLSGLR
jgi:DnaJ-domain-containing protein 1